MAIKIDKLWRDPKFRGLSGLDKLVYIYLCSNGAISTLGVQEHSKQDINYFLPDVGWRFFIASLKRLGERGYVAYYSYSPPPPEGVEVDMEISKVHTIVIKHFKSLPRNRNNIVKASEEYTSMDQDVLIKYVDILVKPNLENSNWDPPTPEEVHNYALSLGYNVNGNTFCDWYGESDWYDKRGKRVRNWKLKVRNVWCRDENKLKKVEGSPEGYEHWGINTEEGVKVYPEKWVGGKPYHSSISMDSKLKEAWGTVLLYKNVI